jgi:NAD-dependent SIR2 family protein deacetylase
VPVAAGDPEARGACAACGARLRPDIVWFGEVPHHLDLVTDRLAAAGTFLSVGTSGVVYPAAGFVSLAARAGALCVEVNPEPAGGPFDLVLPEGAERALPRLLQAWLP